MKKNLKYVDLTTAPSYFVQEQLLTSKNRHYKLIGLVTTLTFDLENLFNNGTSPRNRYIFRSFEKIRCF